MQFEGFKPTEESYRFTLDTWFEHWINDAGYDLVTDFEDDNEWVVTPCITGEEDSESLDDKEAVTLYEMVVSKLAEHKPSTKWREVIRLDQTHDEVPVFRINKELIKKLDHLDKIDVRPEQIGDHVFIAQSTFESVLNQISEQTPGIEFELNPINEAGDQRLFQIIRVHTAEGYKKFGASKEIVELAEFLTKAKLQELYPDLNWSEAITTLTEQTGGSLISIERHKLWQTREDFDE